MLVLQTSAGPALGVVVADCAAAGSLECRPACRCLAAWADPKELRQVGGGVPDEDRQGLSYSAGWLLL